MLELLAASDVTVAVIGAGGAIFGVLAGGLITYELELRREKAQREREEETERRLTQGIARVCSKKLGDFYVLVDEHSPPRLGSSWWKDENDVDPQIDIEDMKRVAAIATPEQPNRPRPHARARSARGEGQRSKTASKRP